MSANANVMTCLPNARLRAQGESILRVTAELRDFLADKEPPASLLKDIDRMEAAGRWLAAASSLSLEAPGVATGGPAAIPFGTAA